MVIEPVQKERSVCDDMRGLFEEIIQLRAQVAALKSGPITKRRERSRLNSSLDRKVRRFKEMRLTFLEGHLTMEHASLQNTLDKAVMELQFCQERGVEVALSEETGRKICEVLESCVSADLKGFFSRSIGIPDNIVTEESG